MLVKCFAFIKSNYYTLYACPFLVNQTHALLLQCSTNIEEISQFSAATAVPCVPVPGDEFAYGEQTPQPFVGLPIHFAPKKVEEYRKDILQIFNLRSQEYI